ncbi:MAG: hypothetical protein ABUL61_03970, partial [Oleiharenicola lentus]
MNPPKNPKFLRFCFGTAIFAAILARAQAAAGIDVILEAATGLSGGAQHGQAYHGLALVHSDWEQKVDSPEAVQFSGYLSGLALAGHGPTERFIGDFLTASNTEGCPSVR